MLIFKIGLLAYLLGSIPFAYLAGRLGGIDVRTAGSGNAGATNVVRLLGKKYGYPVFFLDFVKGVLAIGIATAIARRSGTANGLDVYAIIAGVACVLGHTFPVWLKFRGGKGVATAAGVVVTIAPLATAIAACVWLVVFELTRYVSVASMAAAISLPVAVGTLLHFNHGTGPTMIYFTGCLALLIIIRHRSNISRLVQGTEKRFPRK